LINYLHVIEGITAFFLKKFSMKKQTNSHRIPKRVTSTRSILSPSEKSPYDEPYADDFIGHGLVGHDDSPNPSAVSRNDFLFILEKSLIGNLF